MQLVLLFLASIVFALAKHCDPFIEECKGVSSSEFAHLPSPRPENMLDWNKDHVNSWLFDSCRTLEAARIAIRDWTEKYATVHKTTPGAALSKITLATLRKLLDDDHIKYEHHAAMIFDEIKLRQVAPEFYFTEASKDALTDRQVRGLGIVFNLTEEEAKSSFGVGQAPYPWPYNGIFGPGNTAIIVVDMQIDFMVAGGYMNIVNPGWTPDVGIINPLANVLKKLRELGFHIVHTREGHHHDVKDLPANKYWRTRGTGYYTDSKGEKKEQPGIGDQYFLDWTYPNLTTTSIPTRLLTRGEFGWNIIGTAGMDPYVHNEGLLWAEITPKINEAVVDKPTKGSFANTELDLHLRTRKIQNIIMAGVTTDVCVSTIMREANDLGYECMLLTDGTASAKQWVKEAIIKSIQMSNGIFGTTMDSAALLSGLERYEDLMAAIQEKQDAGHKDAEEEEPEKHKKEKKDKKDKKEKKDKKKHKKDL